MIIKKICVYSEQYFKPDAMYLHKIDDHQKKCARYLSLEVNLQVHKHKQQQQTEIVK